ncbi:RNA-binding region-containing protein 3 [Megalops cyprinoides]|uniref:RNA-binding region-containing protein 3 n=1 Tax=Megalops cyprinoides TaxID=118141 RepID=UPI001864BC46|nr:RNA-binding region-containing protein 3 [Megalops cyprinoides]XP_036377879.1 RNA-binding region-containing protein 3 [Megalops cyprinoides]XP_036377880.1 RNA-binding region-containing protein 3 [Megalops cyprinoides]
MTQSMDNAEEVVKTKRSKTLIVRHLPAELTRDEKEDLLKYFGAVSVRVFSDKGVLKHTAFASFANEKAATKALTRLHQLNILSHSLVVEFAKDQENVTVLKDPPVPNSSTEDKGVPVKKEGKQQQCVPLIENGAAPNLGLKFQTNPSLKYLYPHPSSGILANITHALVSVPKFYVQVLHLMNKMNLPCPFGPITARPPMYETFPTPPPPMPPLPPEYPPLPEEEMEFSSEEESEYESGDDEDKERMIRLMGLVNQPCKRPLRKTKPSARKKPKLKDLLFAPKSDSHSGSVAPLQPSDVFEQPQPCGQKKIEFHISTEVAGVLQGATQMQEEETDETVDNAENDTADEPADGFGKLYPSAQVTQQEEDSSEDEDIPSDFISRRELEKGRLSRDEIKRMSVFKNYEPGDPTCRLYVKNIGKQVEEKDLKYIYGRYIDISSEAERNMFDIVLMKEGRMKGQAFIGLPSEKSAEKALRDTNGYVLYDKPLVVQFARSARPKQDSSDPKKGQKRQ